MRPPNQYSESVVANEAEEPDPRAVSMMIYTRLAGRAVIRVVGRCNEAKEHSNLGYDLAAIDSGEDAQEEFGWKLVHGDVFRPPRKGMLLSVLLGSGVQVFFMTLVTLAFACLGFLSPANRGALMSCAMILYVLLGSPVGYTSARIYKSFGGEKWKSNVLLTSMLCSGIIFGLFFIMNLVLWGEGSSAAIPFSTLVGLLSMWLLVSVPLTFVGAFFGFRPLEHPVRTNKIPRLIPEQSVYQQYIFYISDNLTYLYLSRCELMQVPDAVYHLMRHTELKSCDLSDNVITKIPPKFVVKFAFLKKLNLSHNQVAQLPDGFADLSSLRRLDISHNSFISLPSCIFKIPNLKELNANNNHIVDVEVEYLKEAPSLENVDLSNNPLTRNSHNELERLSKMRIILSPREKEDWEDLNV